MSKKQMERIVKVFVNAMFPMHGIWHYEREGRKLKSIWCYARVPFESDTFPGCYKNIISFNFDTIEFNNDLPDGNTLNGCVSLKV